ncbi:hypothetical protein IT575_01665 [bacterium]|nr:hypothetical protein [bacterium]
MFKVNYSGLLAAPLAALLLLAPALAQGNAKKTGNNDTPPGAVGSVIMTLEQLTNEISTYKIDKFGIHAHFVLPKNWNLEEQGRDPKTNKVKEGLPIYVLTATNPTEKPNDPKDMIFEVDIFDGGLTRDMAAGTSEDARKEERAKRFWNFLNTQMSLNIKSGNKMITQRSDIEAKPYGFDIDEKTGKRTVRAGRPVQYFVPIHYEVAPPKGMPNAKGAYLYTFSTFTGDTPWMIKILLSKEMKDQYGGLIAIILDNSFGLTDADYKALIKARDAAAAQASQKPKQK